MSDIFKIECPECGKKFDAGSAFNRHIENAKKEQEDKIKHDTEQKFKSQLEAKDKEIETNKLAAIKKAEEEADKKYQSQLAQKDQEIEKAKIEEAKKAETAAAEKYKSQLEAKDQEIEKSKLEAIKKAEEEADKKIKSQLEIKEKEIEQRIQNKASSEYLEKMQKKDDDLEKMKKSQEILERRLAQKTDEMNKMMKQGSVELQGEVQEERLQEYLEKMFPEDDIVDVSKGKKGADCIQTINYKDRKNISKIYFESKDTKVFNEDWANKLLRDMQDKGISNGIIVVSPSCMPVDLDKERAYVERHGNVITIIPMIKPIIHGVVNRIRSILILKSRENKDHEIPAVMKQFFEIINSPKFTIPIKNMVSDIKNMKDQLEKDKSSYLLSLSKKEKFIENIYDSLTEMVLPLMNVDKNVIPENILTPQEKVKRISKKDVGKIDKENLITESLEDTL